MVIRKLPAILLLTFALTVQAFSQALPDFQKVVQNTQESIVQILVKQTDKDYFRSYGTGWLNRDSNHIVTAAHVVIGEYKKGKYTAPHAIQVKFLDGEVADVTKKSISSNTDVAVLRIQSKKERTPLKIREKNPQVGDWVVGTGFPLGYGRQIMFNGIVSGNEQVINYSDMPMIVNVMSMNATICPGHSGSAVMNLEGEVVGLAVADNEKFPIINWFMPVEILNSELSKLNQELDRS